MELAALINEPRIHQITTHPEDDSAAWRDDLERYLSKDTNLTRHSAGESAICAIQRLMIFLGYSTASNGAFAIDGDFGRGTNRGVAQFQYEHHLTDKITRDDLCYPCQWNSARKLITAIPEVILTPHTLKTMLTAALQHCDNHQVMTGDFKTAIFHLNALHHNRFLNCRSILDRYGETTQQISHVLHDEDGVLIRPEWILSIIRQETAGIIRPRFEQHYLSRLNDTHPDEELAELRMRSMSLGLGQIMGAHYKVVGAKNATVLFTAPVNEQVAFIARFLKPKHHQTSKSNPTDNDFRQVARFYNGPKYEAHYYHSK